jgi:hypothetical protein
MVYLAGAQRCEVAADRKGEGSGWSGMLGADIRHAMYLSHNANGDPVIIPFSAFNCTW